MGGAKLQRTLTTTERRHLPTVLEDDLREVVWSNLLAKYIDPSRRTGLFTVGFALRVRSVPTVYTEKQLDYVKRIFLEGELPNK